MALEQLEELAGAANRELDEWMGERRIVEILEARNAATASDYLAAGWVLLHVDVVSLSATHPGGGDYVRRVLRYVVGRPAGVPRRDPSMWARESTMGAEPPASPEGIAS